MAEASAPAAINATLYIHGENLDPADATAVLGLEPTRTLIKGQVSTWRDGLSRRVWGHGMWARGFNAEDCADIGALLQRIAQQAEKHGAIPNATHARFDLFICGTTDSEGSMDLEFEIQPEALAALAAAGLPLKVTLGASGP